MAFSQNVLQNPGFEVWSGGLPDNWGHDDSIALFQEDVIVHGGNFSVRDSLFSQTQASADLYQGNFAVQPNTQYTYSVWVYENDPAGRVRQGIYWFPTGSSWSADYSVDTTAWQYLSHTVTSPSDAESALVMVRAYDISTSWDGDAIFYIDDASFEAPSTQPPVIIRIFHDPINPPSGSPTDVYGYVTDDGTIDADTCYYGVNNLNSPIPLMHASAANDTFMYTIPGQTAGDTVLYFCVFVDDDGLSSVSDTHALLVGTQDLYINELLYDTPGSDSGCFVELYGTNSGMNLDGYSIVGVNGYNGSVYVTIDLTGYTLPGDGFFVVAQDSSVANSDMITSSGDMQNGPDNIELRVNNITIDALGYGTLNGWFFTGEWVPAPDVEYAHSLGRYPDGDDTDHNYVDFHDYPSHTPGEPNPYVGIAEHVSTVTSLTVLVNPVRSGMRFSVVVDLDELYPLTVYNACGQMVSTVQSKQAKVDVPCGVYFLGTESPRVRCAKIVVVE
jgi:hypothetical protein